MMRHVFDDLGYRRLEWKCNALNEASMRAARRFGFTYEGTFRQHMVVEGRNRDTAWFSCSTANGRPCAPPSSAGWHPRISTRMADSGCRLPRSCQRRDRFEGTPQCTVTLSVL